MEKEAKNKLHLGCGRHYRKGWVNLDINKEVIADIYHDLEKFPWPFKDNQFDLVYSDNTFEHLSDIIKAGEELWRITKPNGRIIIKAPYASSFGWYRDPTHKSYFTKNTFMYFENGNEFNFYTKARFKVKSRISFITHPHYLKFFNIFIDPIVNTFYRIYELKFAWILPCENIRYELIPIKRDKKYL